MNAKQNRPINRCPSLLLAALIATLQANGPSVALMSQLLAVEPGQRIPEIGTGSGYQGNRM